eukprot:CAMPEP_0198209928 /NCGR_PEP_ID=MMETSP1445-20131203/17818_1 /TAXON_ID=36898 /ORGANISM="Pyramimonas sp., Strain CCMP2087" /LENGTH=218 /DNA_ID=CAMNT_0043883843 /DNA_START=158 /DNA_END=811 /DNA_ORIENTATION=+
MTSQQQTFLDFYYRGISTSLFHLPRSLSSCVHMLLTELCVKDIEIVTLNNLEDLSHELIRSFNPSCKVPILVFMNESQIAMTECGAILTYILGKYDTSHLLHPNPADNAEGFAHYSQLFFFALSTVHPLLSIRIVEAQLQFGEGAGVPKAIDEWQDIVGPKLELYLEEKAGKFLYGDELSPVDMILSVPLSDAGDFGLLNDFPTLEAYLEEIQKQDCW